MARPTDDPKTFRLDLRFPPHLVKRVDEWRRHQPDIPPRAEAIRRLVEYGFTFADLLTICESYSGLLSEISGREELTDEEMAEWGRLSVSFAATTLPLERRLGNEDIDVEAIIDDFSSRFPEALPDHIITGLRDALTESMTFATDAKEDTPPATPKRPKK